MTAVPPLVTVDQLPALAVVPDDALIAVWTANRLWAAPRSAVGGGGGPGTGGYATIQLNGAPLAQRNTLNVTGLLQASDSGGKTVLNLAAIALASQVSGVLPIANGGTGLSVPGSTGQSLRYNSGGLLEAYTPSAGLNAPASPADNAKVAVASGGNLSYAFLTTANLSASAGVAFTQLASMSAARLMGRDSGAGTPVELTVSGGVEFTGSGGIQRSALSGAISAAAGSDTTAFASGDFAALALKTTSSLSLGSGTLASAGDIRGPNAFSLWGRNTSGVGVDTRFLAWDGATPRVYLGSGNTGGMSTYVELDASVGNLSAGTNSTAYWTTVGLFVKTNTLAFDANAPVTSPSITQVANTSGTAGQVGRKLTISAQACTGSAGSTGGDLDIGPGSGLAAGGLGRCVSGSGIARVLFNDTGVGFNGTAPIAKPTVTGLKGGNAALASVLSALAAYGLIIDSSGA